MKIVTTLIYLSIISAYLGCIYSGRDFLDVVTTLNKWECHSNSSFWCNYAFEQTNKQTNKQTNERTNKQTKKQTNKYTLYSYTICKVPLCGNPFLGNLDFCKCVVIATYMFRLKASTIHLGYIDNTSCRMISIQ